MKLHLQAQQVALYTSSGKVYHRSHFENSGTSDVLSAAHSHSINEWTSV